MKNALYVFFSSILSEVLWNPFFASWNENADMLNFLSYCFCCVICVRKWAWECCYACFIHCWDSLATSQCPLWAMILDLAVFDPFWHVFVMQPVHTDPGRDKCVRVYVYVCERESFATLSFSWLLKAVDWILSSYISVALASVAGCAVISVRAVTAAGDTVERVKIWPASSITSTWAMTSSLSHVWKYFGSSRSHFSAFNVWVVAEYWFLID